MTVCQAKFLCFTLRFNNLLQRTAEEMLAIRSITGESFDLEDAEQFIQETVIEQVSCTMVMIMMQGLSDKQEITDSIYTTEWLTLLNE
jgi:hypothetical protein